jgi:hypothetical protein
LTTLEASPQQKILARKLYEQRQAALARVAREIEADKRRQEMERVQPTPQRLAKGDVGQHIIAGEGRKFRTKSPVEHYSGQWPADVEQAFLAYVLDAHAKDKVAVTISYNGNGGGGSNSRLGGLGNVQDRTRDAYERYHWIRDRLTVGSLQIMDWLVLEMRNDASARSVGLEDAGQRLFPSVRDKTMRRGIAIGRLLGAGDELAALYRKFRVLSFEPSRPMKTVSSQ